ncbi:ABC transporter substrate-binding protein [Conexibacter stalactiti]|uniref:ABC transporter substrate-binding protein n=1 Tax=Conexibacter stalactiti TaxID=1940611 RepID=A0ABU4HNY5_9ACTN|nr:ABC transporter substrate-binding protein [Conexibacter stalactiti]MDW5595030.1 ABC transporter substrate-binding protein [Conexibacter stalactiti]MEC5035672.1 ABC transporter substrate-binding protein [Conexibacter stalactiti]
MRSDSHSAGRFVRRITGSRGPRASVLAAVACSLTLAGAGCGASDGADEQTSTGSGATATAAEDVSSRTLKIPETIGGASAILMAVAREEGFFEREGLDVEMIKVGDKDDGMLFLAGRIDMSFGAPIDVALSRAEGVDITVVSPLFNQMTSIYARAGEDATIASLRGTKHGQIGAGSTTSRQLQVLMKEDPGVDYLTHFEQVYSDPQVLPTLLDREQVDSIALFPTLDVPLLAKPDEYSVVYGPMTKIWEETAGQPLMLSGVTVRDEMLEKEPATAAALVQVFKSANEFIAANAEEVVARYGPDLGLRTAADQAELVKLIADGPLYDSDMGPERVRSELRFLEDAVATGVLEELPDGVLYCAEQPDSPACQIVGG